MLKIPTTHILLFSLFLITLTGCTNHTRTQEETSMTNTPRFRENFRPQYHFTPPEKWMNDPNGLLFHNGTYHLFYQYYPDDIVWGPMHWGHAISKDLIQWEHKPVALYPDKLGYIFSGSAVMDTENTSGLGTTEKPPMVAIFTHHDMEGETAGRLDYQVQSIAYSLDEGDTWQKYKGNPVIPNDTGIKDFRDPKVMWYEPSQHWVMSLVAGDQALFYSSKNLINWTLLSTFGKEKGAHGGVWECPDLFELKVEGTEESKWILLISINPGAPNGGSGTQYFIGDWDGTTFTTDQTEEKWIDWGTDNYAGVTYNGLPDEDRTFIAWMSNWDYARDTPTKTWRGAMTLPQTITLHKIGKEYYLKNFPKKTIDHYFYDTNAYGSAKDGAVFSCDNFNQTQLAFTLEGTLKTFHLDFTNKIGNSLGIGYTTETDQFYVDRKNSGIVHFEKSFANAHSAPATVDTREDVTFSIFLDASSIELFVDGGATSITDQIFPEEPYTEMTFTSEEGTLIDLKISKVKSIWE